MRYLSVCSGIEAATVAWKPLGWEAVGFSEIEKFPAAVLAHHYPDVPNFGDMTKFKEWPDDLAPDLIVGGTPCQSFSVAGLRKGLADPRGNLALTYLALADRYRPEWLVWENVPGVLSSNGGRDFGAFLGGLAKLGYGFAYRVLDAQYFGVAQRRRRVFVVANARDWRRAAAVLFERHSLSGHPAPRREAGEGVAFRSARSLGNEWPHEVAGTLDAHYGDKMGLEDQHIFNQKASRFAPVPFDTTQITSAANYSSPKPGGPCHPLAAGAHAPAIAFNWQGGGTQTSLGYDPESGITGSLHVGQTPAVAFQPGNLSRGAGSSPSESIFPTLKSDHGRGLSDQQPQVMQGMAVRRLTPRECERLQGFPEIEKHYRIRVCRDFSDQQKQNARAALKCPKWPSNVWRADASGWTLSASAAADHSSTSHPDHEPPVAVDVLIDLERQVVRLHSQGRSFSPASSVGDRSEFPLPTGVESFARLAVLLTHAWDLATPDGKAASPASTTHSIPHWSGSSIALLSGREIGGHADDAANAIATATRLSTSTTLPSGLDTQTYDSMLETLCCCVVHAIGSYIPGTTSAASSFDVRLTTTRGYTAIPWRGKPASECPDGPRYKALGNSMAVPVMRWIGERIAAVAAQSEAREAA